MNQFTATEALLLEQLERVRGSVRDGRHEWIATVDAISDPLMVHDAEGRIVRANQAYAAVAGLPFQDLIGRPYWECFPRRAAAMPGCIGGRCWESEGEEFAVAGSEVYTSKAYALGSGAEVLHLFHNVTRERGEQSFLQARSQRAIAQSEALSAIASSGALYAGDVDTLAREITEQVSRACGAARANVWLFNADESELHCVDHFDAATRSHARGMVLRQAQFENEFLALKSAPYVAADDPLTDPRTAGYVEAYLRPNRISAMLDAVVSVSGRHLGLLCVEHVDRPHHWESDEIAFARQVAEKIAIAVSNRRARLAEAAMRANEQRFRALFDQAPVGISEVDATGRYRNVNRRLCEITGYSAEELRARSFRDITHAEDLGRDEDILRRLLAGEIRVYATEKRYLRKDGAVVWASLTVTPVADAGDGTVHLVSIVEDITKRRAAETALRDSRDLLQSVIENAPVRVFWKDAELRYLGCNSAFARDAGLDTPAQLIGKDDFQMAWHAQAEKYRADDRAVIGSDAPKLGIEEPQSTPDGRTAWLRTSKVPLHDAAGTVIGMLGIYDDVTELRQQEEDLRRTNRALRSSLEGTIIALGATMESRDPYTAGHQHRVASLASAIATEMGLPSRSAEGVYFGALIHDLGKIQVPAEILSKPGRLTGTEFALIKAHPQTGYDIVKNIDFPWPIAPMVLQHHERLDGSGYPQGLKGDAIALEARILAVADVVEAMATHRPYRAGLGIDVALEQIEQQRGTWFDASAVDACLRLFREKGYSLDKGRPAVQGPR